MIKIVSADGPEPLGQEWTIFPTADEIRWTLAEATRSGRLKAAHAMCHDAIEVVTRAGTDTVEHGWYLTEQNCRTMLEHDVYLIPTASNIWAIVRNGPALGMSWAPMVAADEQRMMDGYRMAIELGVKIALGTDVGGNISHFYGDSALELEVYVHCGMSPLDAIAAGTLEAAKAIKRARLGRLDRGRQARRPGRDRRRPALGHHALTRTGVAARRAGRRRAPRRPRAVLRRRCRRPRPLPAEPSANGSPEASNSSWTRSIATSAAIRSSAVQWRVPSLSCTEIQPSSASSDFFRSGTSRNARRP